MIDVIFLLLVFFLYAMVTMSVHRGIGVSLPKTVAESLAGKRVVVTLAADGKVYIEGEEVAEDSLAARLASDNTGAPVLISADEKIPLGRGLRILSDIQNSGIKEVAFQTTGTKD